MVDINQLLPEVMQLVGQAGNILMAYFHGEKSNHISCKESGDLGSSDLGNIVTEADLESERFLLDMLGKLLPEASFYAEESGKSGKGDYRWVIDPLDGTSNFAHGLDYFCISVALTHHDEPILGVVYRPVMDEMFWATAGGGAFCNGRKLYVSATKNLGEAFVGSCLPYSKVQLESGLKVFETITRNVAGIRKFGAAALDQAHVAAGKLEAVFFQGLGWWDVAAGMLLVTEARGQVTDYEGKKIGPDYRSFLASNKEMHEQLLRIIGK